MNSTKLKNTKVVSNSGPLIHLAKIDYLWILKELFGQILVPKDVKIETVDVGLKIGAPDSIVIQSAMEDGWIKIIDFDIPPRFQTYAKKFRVHVAELKVILYAKSNNLLALLDDFSARVLADNLSVKVMGSLGIILLATKKSIINKKDALNALDKIAKVMYLNIPLYLDVRDRIMKL